MPRHFPLAALLTAGAGATHLAAAVPHFSSNPLYGTLFVGAGWGQFVLAALLMTSARTGVTWAAIGLNAGSLVAWAVSRTVGLPLAHPEPVLLADAVTVALEVAAIVVLVARVRGAAFGLRAGQAMVLPLVAVLALSFGASTVSIADLSSEDHAHGSGSGGGDDHQASAEGHHAGAKAEGRQAAAEDHHAGADASRGKEAGSSSDSGGGADKAHEHPDGTVHIHEAGRPHVHPDRTVHVHTVNADQRSGEQSAVGHGKNGGDGHSHEHNDEH